MADHGTEKRSVLVIGAGDATGGAIARRFAREGYVAVVTRREAASLQPLLDRIRADGGEAHGFGSDARVEDEVVNLFNTIEEKLAPLEVVVFNIGANVNFPIRETTSRVYRKVWEMACFAGFLTGREAAKYMTPRRRGSIFFTGATASLRGRRGYDAFASAQFGPAAPAPTLARELGPEQIHVAHLVIDAGVDTAWVRERIRAAGGDPAALPENTLMNPASVAEAFWSLHRQPPDAWTFELDLRPHRETW